MKNKKLIYSISGLSLVVLLGVIFIVRRYENYLDSVNRYFAATEDFRQFITQNVTIYEEYANAEIEKELRSHLLQDHLHIARDLKFVQISKDDEVQKLARDGQLFNIETGPDYSYYFYNVPKEFRFLRGFTKEGLKLITDRFTQKLFEKSADVSNGSPESAGGDSTKNSRDNSNENPENNIKKFKVKLAISSAIRPAQYQKNLRDRNGNASAESTHSYGISFDIFYDDFFVGSPLERTSFKNRDFEKIRRMHGFALGTSLRRQFQTILSKTLIELQREKKLYAIFEPNQRCYHVTILP